MRMSPFCFKIIFLIFFIWEVDWNHAAKDNTEDPIGILDPVNIHGSNNSNKENPPEVTSKPDIPSHSTKDPGISSPYDRDLVFPPDSTSNSDITTKSGCDKDPGKNERASECPLNQDPKPTDGDPGIDGTKDQRKANMSAFFFLDLNVECHLDKIICSHRLKDNRMCYCDNECVVLGDCCADWYTKHVSDSYHGILKVMEDPFSWYMGNADDSRYASILTMFLRNSKCMHVNNGSDIIPLGIITSCPKDYTDNKIKDDCESGSMLPYENIPVSLRIKGPVQIVFKNEICALCNGFFETELEVWAASALCPRYMPPQISEEFKEALRKDCSFFISPPPDVGELRHCNRQDSDSSQECDGYGQLTGPNMSTACKAYVAPVYDSSSRRRNPHCAICRNGNESNLYCGLYGTGSLLPPPFDISGERAGINILFNFNPTSGSWYSSDHRDCQETEAWYPDKNGCHLLHCPKNFIPSYGNCIDDPFAIYNATSNIPFDQNERRNYNIYIEIVVDDKVRSLSPIHKGLQLLTESLLRSGIIIIKDFQLNSTFDEKVGLFDDDSTIYHMTVNASSIKELEVIVVETLDTVHRFDHVTAELTNIEDKKSLNCNNTSLTQLTPSELTSIENSNLYVKLRDSNITINLYSTKYHLTMDKVNKQPTIRFIGLCKEELSINCSLLSYSKGDYEIKDSEAYINNIQEIITYFDLRNEVLYVCENLTYSGSPQTDEAMQILTVVMLSLSIVSLFILVCMHCSFPSLRTQHGKNLMAFSASLLTAQSLFLIGSYVYSTGILCFIVAISQHYFWLCSFIWTSVMAFDLAHKLGAKTMMSYKTSNAKKTVCVAHGLPLLIVASCALVDIISSSDQTVGYGAGNSGYCWIGNPQMSLFVFGVPVAICLMFNIICFGISVHGLRGTKQSAKTVRNNKQERNYCLIYTKITILLGGTWIFGFIGAAINFTPILYINVCLNGLQGFFLFLGFILNARVMRLLRRKKLTTSSTTSLHSSELTDISRQSPQMTKGNRY